MLRHLATSLAAQIWTTDALIAHLKHRLPPELHRVARPLARVLISECPGSAAPDAAKILVILSQSAGGKRIVEYAKRTGTSLDPDLTPPRFLPLPQFTDLPALSTLTDLADWLAISPDQLTRFADLRLLSARTESVFAPHYRHHLIPKRDGMLRLIEEPKPFLKTLQRRLLCGLIAKIPTHDTAFAFVAKRNCIKAAAKHAGEACVVSFDLADFFPRVGFHRIYGLFRAVGYPAGVARHLAGLCTSAAPHLSDHQIAARDFLIGRHLPQGAPTSPALANLVAFRLDQRLFGLAERLGATYTRYADDLTFSGDGYIASVLADAVPKIVADEGFLLRVAKTRVMPKHNRQLVTGIVVNATLSLPRKTRDRLKATLHHLSRPSDPRRFDPAFMASLSGEISWVEQVSPHHGLRFRQPFESL
ncbi:MAG: reverse transcriptase family protein [Deltaproteobacteria bacterium]